MASVTGAACSTRPNRPRSLSLAGRKHQLLYGFEFGRQSKDLLSYSQVNVATVSRFNPVLPTLPLRINGKPSADNHSVFKVASLYLQDLVSINSQWKALAGVRYDRFQQETHERQPGRPDLGRTGYRLEPARRAGLSAIVGMVLPCIVGQFLPALGRNFCAGGKQCGQGQSRCQGRRAGWMEARCSGRCRKKGSTAAPSSR